MGMRFAKSGKVMPSGVLSLVGAASTLYHVRKYQEWS